MKEVVEEVREEGRRKEEEDEETTSFELENEAVGGKEQTSGCRGGNWRWRHWLMALFSRMAKET